MKKNEKNTNTSANTNKKEIKDYFASILNTSDEAIKSASKNEKGNATRYELSEGITFTIVDSEKERDLGSLTIYGVSINVTIAMGKNGAFVSYPSYKKNDGEYKNLVTSYSKSLNDLIKDILAYHYEG